MNKIWILPMFSESWFWEMYCTLYHLVSNIFWHFGVRIWFLAHTLTLDRTFWTNSLLKKRLYIYCNICLDTYMADLIKLGAKGNVKEQEDNIQLYDLNFDTTKPKMLGRFFLSFDIRYILLILGRQFEIIIIFYIVSVYRICVQ